MENSMNLKVSPRTAAGGVQALDLEGEVDVYTAPGLRQAIMDQIENGTSVGAHHTHLRHHRP
jgi:anti-anti-sigma regulatory factor